MLARFCHLFRRLYLIDFYVILPYSAQCMERMRRLIYDENCYNYVIMT